jgi:hypothetical protein
VATGYVILPIPGGIAPDQSGTINNGMAPTKKVNSGTQTTNAPKSSYCLLLADPTTDEHWMWPFVMPGDYASGGVLRVVLESVTTNAGNVILKAAVAQSTDGSTDNDSGNTVFDTVVTSAAIANPTTVGQTVSGTLTLTGSYTANRGTVIMLGRDADNGSDTLNSNDVGVKHVTFEYTTT